MSKILEEIIHESQTAYIPGRYVHDNLRSLELIKQKEQPDCKDPALSEIKPATRIRFRTPEQMKA